MKSYQLSAFGLENLKIANSDDRALLPNEVRVELKACSLNYRDLMVIRGQYNPNLKMPLTPCSDGSGVVLEVGSLVREFRPGDRVCATFSQNWLSGHASLESAKSTLGSPLDGTLREQGIFLEHGLVKFPDFLSFEEAAMLPCAGLTAFSALVNQVTLNPGATVLIEGTGGVAIFALQFAKALSLKTIVTSSSDAKLEKAKSLGATHVINYQKNEDWSKEARRLTNGDGVDMVIEVGGGATLGKGIHALKRGGVSCIIGVLSGSTCDFDLRPILMNEIRLQGVFVGSRELFLAMNRVVEHAKIKPVIDRVFAFDEAVEALKYFETAQHFGKVCIRI